MVHRVPLAIADMDQSDFPAYAVAARYLMSVHNLRTLGGDEPGEGIVVGDGQECEGRFTRGVGKEVEESYEMLTIRKCPNLATVYASFQEVVRNLTSEFRHVIWSPQYLEVCQSTIIIYYTTYI